jgi:myo-inositol-1-phosphate synthase
MSREAVRVGIVGVGELRVVLRPGLTYYRDARRTSRCLDDDVEMGGYHVGDVQVASAFDVTAAKVGRDVAEAILARRTTRTSSPPCRDGRAVRRGPTLDGIGRYLRDELEEAEEPVADVAGMLEETRTDVLVSYLPVGSQRATEFLRGAGVARGLCLRELHPRLHRLRPDWRRKFEERGCRSSATTSRARSARRSCTARSRTCSASAACGWTAPTS